MGGRQLLAGCRALEDASRRCRSSRGCPELAEPGRRLVAHDDDLGRSVSSRVATQERGMAGRVGAGVAGEGGQDLVRHAR